MYFLAFRRPKSKVGIDGRLAEGGAGIAMFS